jgi:hypothetical protein
MLATTFIIIINYNKSNRGSSKAHSVDSFITEFPFLDYLFRYLFCRIFLTINTLLIGRESSLIMTGGRQLYISVWV